MTENKDVYSVYKNDHIQHGYSIAVGRTVNLESEKVDISELTLLTDEEIQKKRESSIEKENAIYEKICGLATEWEEHAANTKLFDKAIEYLGKPPVAHTSNDWVEGDKGHNCCIGTISNMVYEMSYQIYEVKRFNRGIGKQVPDSWDLSWNVSIQNPGNYSGYGEVIAGQTSKRFKEMASMNKYLHARKSEFSHLFTEISPPIPQGHKERFCVNGKLLPGYTLEEPKPKEAERKVEDATTEKPKRGRKPSVIGGLSDAKKLAAIISDNKENQTPDKLKKGHEAAL